MYIKRIVDTSNAALAPLVALIAAIDEADLLNVDLPLEMPGLLEQFLDPEIQAGLPEVLRVAAAEYLNRLPGYREGDFQRAAEQHALRVELWLGEAQIVEDTEIGTLGLEEPDDS